MALLGAMLHTVDSSGNRVQNPQSDGSYLPEVIKIGAGVTATQTTNGGICEIELSAGISVGPVAIVAVRFTTGTPAVAGVLTNIAGVDASTFTLTDNGTGNVSVSWPAGKFSLSAIGPEAHSFGWDTVSSASCLPKGVRKVQVLTVDNTGTPQDSNFNLHIFGDNAWTLPPIG